MSAVARGRVAEARGDGRKVHAVGQQETRVLFVFVAQDQLALGRMIS
jgi:hypothetical protein